LNLKIKSELGAIQPQKENDIGGGYPVGEATKYRGRKKHSAYLQIIFKRNLNEEIKRERFLNCYSHHDQFLEHKGKGKGVLKKRHELH